MSVRGTYYPVKEREERGEGRASEEVQAEVVGRKMKGERSENMHDDEGRRGERRREEERGGETRRDEPSEPTELVASSAKKDKRETDDEAGARRGCHSERRASGRMDG